MTTSLIGMKKWSAVVTMPFGLLFQTVQHEGLTHLQNTPEFSMVIFRKIKTNSLNLS